ncbi:DUF6804 family protein [Flavobacterium ammonificans]|uniref:DUF2809 domain-containing protein n=1 Tax=Flavobacterium ammonificans TaxID=1751056 RepID=A0ABM7UYZ7_9FLAO|nr:DUF6804 family protein [Flavobacterium ammonificans]BDB53076.1 hypothetical protein GENT11_13880 [Flavobacterium ammonificans]
MIRIIKIVLASLLLLCLLDMPYSFFQLVRFVSMAGFVFLAYTANENNSKNEMLLYVLLAILFQPFEKIALGRELWNIVDVIVALFLLITLKRK